MWHKQRHGLDDGNSNQSFLKGHSLSLSFSLLHPCFIYDYLCLYLSSPVSSSQSSTFTITITFSSALRRLYFPPARRTLPSLGHLAPLPSTSLSPAFCLSKGRLLVPYQTLMNYKRPLSSGPWTGTRLTDYLPRRRSGEQSCGNPVRNTLFCGLAG